MEEKKKPATPKKKAPTPVRANPVIAESVAWFYEKFPSRNSGAEWVIGTFPHLYRAALARELRGKFTRGELSMILDVLNGSMALMAYVQSGSIGQSIGLSLLDSFEIYPGMYEEKWGVDKKEMMGKIETLTQFQRACLEVWAAFFWQGDYNAPDAVEKHCAILENKEG
jgi:hypothetical protein